jgi:GntR family transcriptional regulator
MNGPMYQQVANSLRQDIRSGKLRDGQALPSARELARRWATSTYTISRALSLIRAEGLITTKPRSMSIVNASTRTTGCTCECHREKP